MSHIDHNHHYVVSKFAPPQNCTFFAQTVDTILFIFFAEIIIKPGIVVYHNYHKCVALTTGSFYLCVKDD